MGKIIVTVTVDDDDFPSVNVTTDTKIDGNPTRYAFNSVTELLDKICEVFGVIPKHRES